MLGAVVHGIGATPLEWMRYDVSGQPLTASYGDYLLPTFGITISDLPITPERLHALIRNSKRKEA